MPPHIQQVKLLLHLEIHITDITEGKIPMGMTGLHQPPLEADFPGPRLMLLSVPVNPLPGDHTLLKSVQGQTTQSTIPDIQGIKICTTKPIKKVMESK